MYSLAAARKEDILIGLGKNLVYGEIKLAWLSAQMNCLDILGESLVRQTERLLRTGRIIKKNTQGDNTVGNL